MRPINKKVILIASLFVIFYLIRNASTGYAAVVYPSKPTVDKPGPQQKQTLTITVTAEDIANPGVYWFQLDDGSWRAQHSGGTFTDTPNVDPSHRMNEPRAKWVRDRIDLRNYSPGNYSGEGIRQVPKKLVTNQEIMENKSQYIKNDTSYHAKDSQIKVVDKTFVDLNVLTGKKKQTLMLIMHSPIIGILGRIVQMESLNMQLRTMFI